MRLLTRRLRFAIMALAAVALIISVSQYGEGTGSHPLTIATAAQAAQVPPTPAIPVVPYQGHLVPVPSLGPLPRHFHGIRLPGSPAPTAYDAYYAGYAVTADDYGINHIRIDDITEAAGTLTVPAIDCGTSVMGTSGTAFVDNWVGIDGYGGDTVEQAGIESYCTGPAGGDGTAGPYYHAWYFICCNAGTLQLFPSQPALHPGDTLKFTVADTSPSGCCEDYTFTYVDVSDSNHTETETLACDQGSTPCEDENAEVITEDPGGGAPSYVLPSWDPTYGNYSGISVEAQYTSPTGEIEHVDGTLNSNGSYWASSGELSMDFMGTLSFPYNITGPPYGEPQSLNSDGNAFNAYCTNYTSTTAYSYCPG
jgi:hypothetical protein